MSTYLFGKRTGATHTTGHKDVYVGYDSGDASIAAAALTKDTMLSVSNYATVAPAEAYVDVALMRFDLSALTGKTVTSAILQLIKTSGDPVAADTELAVMYMGVAWGVDDTDEGADEDPATGGQATWNAAMARVPFPPPGPTTWPGGTFGDMPLPYGMVPLTGFDLLPAHTVGHAYDIDLTAAVVAWLTDPLIPNHGIAIVATTPTEDYDDWGGFGSQEESDAAKRWLLTVETDEVDASTPMVRRLMARRRHR